jgi:nicotinamide riboside kinase
MSSDDPENTLFLRDKELSSEDEDKFGHTEYADVLENIISKVEPPWQIGLFGGWGTGKTTIVKFLANRLEGEENILHVYFDAWQHAEASIRTEMLLKIDEELGKKVESKGILGRKISELRNKEDSKGILGEDRILEMLYDTKQKQEPENDWLKRARSWISTNYFSLGALSLLIGVPALLTYLEILLISQSIFVGLITFIVGFIFREIASLARSTRSIGPRKDWSGAYEKIFDEILEKVDNETDTEKLVITIDNLDRCDPEVVYDVLVTIKTFMEKEPCIYIVPCDIEALQQHIEGLDKENKFLEKFFQSSIKISPIIPEDVDAYLEQINQELDEPFDTEVLEIVSRAYIDRPRGAKKSLNNLVVKRMIAREYEEQGRITAEEVLENMAFLAKITVIETEYPQLYDKLQEDPYLLEEINKYFLDRTIEKRQTVESMFGDEGKEDKKEGISSEEQFLRTTMAASTENPRPFFYMNKPEYSIKLDGSIKFIQSLRNNDVEHLKEELVEADSSEFRNYCEAISDSLEQFRSQGKRNSLFNGLDALMKVLPAIESERRQEKIADIMSKYLRGNRNRRSLSRFEPAKMFVLIPKITIEDNRNRILELYADEVGRDEIPWESLLKGFTEICDIMPDSAKQNVDSGIKHINEEMEEAIRFLSDNENGNEFVGDNTLEGAVRRIGWDRSNSTELNNLDLYQDFDNIASDSARGTYVSKLISLMPNENDGYPQRKRDKIIEELTAVQRGINPEAAEDLFHSMKEEEKNSSKQNQKYVFSSPLVYFLESFSRTKKKEVRNWLQERLNDWNRQPMRKFFQENDLEEVDIYGSKKRAKETLDCAISLRNENFISNQVVSTVLAEGYSEEVKNWLLDLVENGNTLRTKVAAHVFYSYVDYFGEIQEDIADHLMEEFRNSSNKGDMKLYLESTAPVIDQLPEKQKKNFIKRLSDLMKERSDYAKEVWEKTGDLETEYEKMLGRKVIEEIESNRHRDNSLIEILEDLDGRILKKERKEIQEKYS